MLLLMLGYAFVDDPSASEDATDLLVDSLLMTLFVVVALGGCVLSWARSSTSTVMFIAIGIIGAATGAITAGEDQAVSALINGGPYLAAAVIAWFSSSSPRHREEGEPY